MSIYFSKHPLWSIVGVFLIGLGLYHLLVHFYLSGILFVILGIANLFSHHFTYISLYDRELIIRGRRFIPWNKKIPYQRINHAEIIGDETVLHLDKDRHFKLNNRWMEENGINILKQIFEKKNISIK